MAEAYRELGQPEAGLTSVNEGFRLMDDRGERLYAAELWRLKGELLLTQESKNQKPVLNPVEGSKSKRQKSENPNPTSTPNPASETEACFLQAIDVARHQHAKSLELRAVMSLVRLRQQHASGHASRHTHHTPRTALAEARTMLAEVYGWFTEGFDTKDLQEAKALLETLSG